MTGRSCPSRLPMLWRGIWRVFGYWIPTWHCLRRFRLGSTTVKKLYPLKSESLAIKGFWSAPMVGLFFSTHLKLDLQFLFRVWISQENTKNKIGDLGIARKNLPCEPICGLVIFAHHYNSFFLVWKFDYEVCSKVPTNVLWWCSCNKSPEIFFFRISAQSHLGCLIFMHLTERFFTGKSQRN